MSLYYQALHPLLPTDPPMPVAYWMDALDDSVWDTDGGGKLRQLNKGDVVGYWVEGTLNDYTRSGGKIIADSSGGSTDFSITDTEVTSDRTVFVIGKMGAVPNILSISEIVGEDSSVSSSTWSFGQVYASGEAKFRCEASSATSSQTETYTATSNPDIWVVAYDHSATTTYFYRRTTLVDSLSAPNSGWGGGLTLCVKSPIWQGQVDMEVRGALGYSGFYQPGDTLYDEAIAFLEAYHG